MFLKRLGLAVLFILTFAQIAWLINDIVEAAEKGSDTPLNSNCVTDCATYSSQVTSGITACVIFAVIWIWIFRRRRKNRSSTETFSSEQESTSGNERQEKRSRRSRKEPFDDSGNDPFGSDDEQGSIFS
tara:strand:+ start:744 stop:1130 length:387 start_codon:yes stop_codon:yes gene_type:complete